MKIKFLGTAAAEAVPALFCDCEVCKKSRKSGGRNIRTRSQAIVDDKILIDFPADTYMHSLVNNIELSKVHTCIITHSHSDHLYPEDIAMRGGGFAHTNEATLSFYASHPGYVRILNTLASNRMESGSRASVKRVEGFKPFEAEGYNITPFKASHDPKTDPVFYGIEKDGKNLLYANDTGIFPEETWKYMEENPVKYDLISFDCTLAVDDDWWGHMGLSTVKKVRQRMLDMGLTHEKTVYVLHHFSHNSKLTYDDMVPIAEKEGFLVSYDGMEIEF